MLFIRNYDKFSLDRSSTSIVDYYRQLLSRLNIDIFNLRNDLTDLLNQVRALRTDLINIKNEIQDILNEDRALAQQLGYTSTEFDAIQGILDAAEEELEDLEKDIESTINRIDCSEIPDTCNYTDYTDCSETNEEPIEEPPKCDYTSEPKPDCSYCSFSVIDGDCSEEISCMLCQFDDCNVDRRCDEEGEMWSAPTNGCTYIEVSTTDPACNQVYTTTNDLLCGEMHCDLDNIHVDTLPENCTFNCTHYSDCVESSIPVNCTYSCTDHGCSYGTACNECNYESSCTHNNCNFNTGSCSYTENDYCNYDSNCGVDVSCSEWTCGEALEGCNDCGDCNDCGQDCGEITCEGGDDYDPSCDECDI